VFFVDKESSYKDMLVSFFWPAVLVAFVVMCAAEVSLWVPVFVFVAVFAAEIVVVLLAMR